VGAITFRIPVPGSAGIWLKFFSSSTPMQFSRSMLDGFVRFLSYCKSIMFTWQKKLKIVLVATLLLSFVSMKTGLANETQTGAKVLKNPPALEQVLVLIKKAAANLTTLSATMEQKKHLEIFSEDLISTGLFYFRRPDCWRWEISSPVHSGLAVCNGRGRRWHEKTRAPEEFELAQEPWLFHFAAQVTAWTTGDFELLRKHYDLRLLASEPPLIELVPKAPQARRLISALEISFSSDFSYVETVTIRETDGDFTHIRFSQTKLNHPLPPDLF